MALPEKQNNDLIYSNVSDWEWLGMYLDTPKFLCHGTPCRENLTIFPSNISWYLSQNQISRKNLETWSDLNSENMGFILLISLRQIAQGFGTFFLAVKWRLICLLASQIFDCLQCTKYGMQDFFTLWNCSMGWLKLCLWKCFINYEVHCKKQELLYIVWNLAYFFIS